MIEIRDRDGSRHTLAPSAIARVSKAGTTSQWHGTRCYVYCFDGQVIESSDTYEYVIKLWEDANGR